MSKSEECGFTLTVNVGTARRYFCICVGINFWHSLHFIVTAQLLHWQLLVLHPFLWCTF